MRVKVCLIVMLNAMALSLGRGPHHPHGQEPVAHKHYHHKPGGTQSLTGDTQLLHDTKHIEEDSQVFKDMPKEEWEPEKLEFFYFVTHDFDDNGKLDGLELLKALYHTQDHEAPAPDADSSIEPEANSLDSYIGLVDRTLEIDDIDGDGYLSYPEYRSARDNDPSERTSKVHAAINSSPP